MNRKFRDISDAAHSRGRYFADFSVLFKVRILIDFDRFSGVRCSFLVVEKNRYFADFGVIFSQKFGKDLIAKYRALL